MSDRSAIRHQVVIETTPELAFEALTKASELREWFSDQAWTDIWPGGRYEVRWNQGYRAEGTFIELHPPRRAAVTWQGPGEPGQTTVEFTVEAVDEKGVKVAVIHSGFGSDAGWDGPRTEADKGWLAGLENLKSTLETGVDLRSARQPFLGIGFEALSPERATEERIAADRGIYITDVVKDSGAMAAGLDRGDVLVALGASATHDSDGLVTALRAHRADDVVDVEVVRGQERKTIQVTLGKRPQPDVPDTAEGLARVAAEQYRETDTELRAAVEGLGEKEAGQSPAQGEWSVEQVLAHLSIVERDSQSYLASLALDGWRDDGPGNPTVMPGRLTAVLSTTPTLQGLLDRLFADEAEMVAFLRGLPEGTVSHKARFYRIGQFMMDDASHTRSHIDQIKEVIKSVRGS